MDKSHSYELLEMTGTPLQHEELRDRTNNLASSLAHRRYADIDWIRSAVQRQNEEINDRDIVGRPLLQVLLRVQWKGVENSLEDGLKLLMDSGAEVDLKDKHDQTALHVAVEEKVPKEALQTLVERSGNVNATDNNHKTPLHLLLDRSDSVDSGLLTTLLAAGANPFYSHDDGKAQVDCPLLLLLNKTDTLIKNLRLFREICPEDESRMAKTLLHRALSCDKAVTVDLLLQEIGSISPLCDPGELLLIAAQSAQDAEMKIDLLLEHGVDLEATTSLGMGLSHMAALSGSLRVLQKATTGLKSVIDKTDSDGNTPLHYAASSKSNDQLVVDCVNYLVSVGANTDVENNRGHSPLDTALTFKKKAVVVALVRAGSHLPKPRVAHTLTIDQLSLLVDFDVIAAFRNPIVATLKMSGLMQRISTNAFNVHKDQYCELSQQLEKTASKMLTFGIKGVSDVNNQVLFAAVENNMKQFVSENEVQDHVDRQWFGTVTGLRTSKLSGFIISFYWAVITGFFPFIILFYALPRYGSKYRIFLDDLLTKKSSFAISHFVHVIYHSSFIFLLVYDTDTKAGIVSEGEFSATDASVFYFFSGFLLYKIEQCRMKGIKAFFSSWINVADLFIMLLFATCFVTRMIDIVYLDGSNPSTDLFIVTLSLASASYAVASFLFIIRFISFLKVFPTIGPIILSFKRIIRDSLSFLVLWGLLILAFSIFLSRGYAANAYQTHTSVLECVQEMINGSNVTDAQVKEFSDQCGAKVYYDVVPGPVRGFPSALTLIWAVFGLADREDFNSSERSATVFGNGLLIVWNVVAIIILSNIMIAIVTNAFQSVQDNADIEWKFSKAEILCDHQTSPRVPPPANVLYYVAILIARIVSFCLSPQRYESSSGYREQDDEVDVSRGLLAKLEAWKVEELMENTVNRGDLVQEVSEIKSKLNSIDAALTKLMQCYSASIRKAEDNESSGIPPHQHKISSDAPDRERLRNGKRSKRKQRSRLKYLSLDESFERENTTRE